MIVSEEEKDETETVEGVWREGINVATADDRESLCDA